MSQCGHCYCTPISYAFSDSTQQRTNHFGFHGGFMNEHIYKQIELTGTSKTSIEDAVQNAITKASKTLHNLHWFQIIESRGYIENNKIDYWQVTIKLGFRLDD